MIYYYFLYRILAEHPQLCFMGGLVKFFYEQGHNNLALEMCGYINIVCKIMAPEYDFVSFLLLFYHFIAIILHFFLCYYLLLSLFVVIFFLSFVVSFHIVLLCVISSFLSFSLYRALLSTSNLSLVSNFFIILFYKMFLF